MTSSANSTPVLSTPALSLISEMPAFERAFANFLKRDQDDNDTTTEDEDVGAGDDAGGLDDESNGPSRTDADDGSDGIGGDESPIDVDQDCDVENVSLRMGDITAEEVGGNGVNDKDMDEDTDEDADMSATYMLNEFNMQLKEAMRRSRAE